MKIITTLHPLIKAICPIVGLSIGRENDKTTWRIDFKPEATAQQRRDAQAVIDSFDPTAFNASVAADAARIAADQVEHLAVKTDVQVQSFLNMTDDQIGATINAAFGDPAQQNILKRLARLVQNAARGRTLRS